MVLAREAPAAVPMIHGETEVADLEWGGEVLEPLPFQGKLR